MFADMVGFTALMGRDEDAAREKRDRQREVVTRLVGEYSGRVMQFYGDGTLSVFESAVEAARCAMAIQAEVRRPPEVSLRIGLHVGDVVHEGDGVYGDGVNVASRVEGLAPTGGIVISDKVFDEIKNHPELEAVSLGKVRLKNVSRPVEIFALCGEGLPVPAPDQLKNRGRRGTRRAVAFTAPLVTALLALGLWFGASRVRNPDSGSSMAAQRVLPSVAVLPFRTLGAGQNDSDFSDGLHDDILTQLAKVSSLDVIARTSVMRFAGSEAPIPDIGRELRVATILEGGVQRSGTRIRLNVQLIDTETDTHLWGETYDRELSTENIFAIQSELAGSIAEELRVVLKGDEERALAEVPTVSLQAYDLYLRGSRPVRNSQARRDLREAEEALTQAIQIDDEFGLAHARLAQVHLQTYWFAFDRTDERLEKASAAVQRAEDLDPESAEALIARGFYHYYGFRNYAAADEAFTAAQRVKPGDARLLEARALVLRRDGRWDESVRFFEAAIALDPLNADLLGSFAETLQYMGEYSLAGRALNEALAADSTDLVIRSRLAYLDVVSRGDLTLFNTTLEGFGNRSELTFERWQSGYIAGSDSMALAAADDVDGLLEQQTALYSGTLLKALHHRSRGREEESSAAADSAAMLFEGVVRQHPDDPRAYAALGTAYALQNLRDPALRAGNEAVRLLPVSRDAMDGPEYLLHLARIHALLGDHESAADLVVTVLSAPSDNSLASVLLNPSLSALRDHPKLRNR